MTLQQLRLDDGNKFGCTSPVQARRRNPKAYAVFNSAVYRNIGSRPLWPASPMRTTCSSA